MLDPMSGNLERYLTFVSTRQRLVASNIANADTPGYKTKDVDFDAHLQSALASPVPQEVAGLVTKNDGNNVNLDREARLLAENDLRFNIASNLLHSKLKILRMAVGGSSSSS